MKSLNADSLAATSESEQMYLLHTALAVEAGEPGPVPVSHLARALGVSTAAANEMIHKLVERGLVEYSPYKGVTLTAAGSAVAGAVLRRRRLWTVFLVDRLGFDSAAAEAVACDLEHVTPRIVTDRLAAYLGDPTQGPNGRAIPLPDSASLPATAGVVLPEGATGRRYRVTEMHTDPAAAGYLASQGVAGGRELVIESVGPNGEALIRTGAGIVALSGELGRAIRLAPLEESP